MQNGLILTTLYLEYSVKALHINLLAYKEHDGKLEAPGNLYSSPRYIFV